MSSIGSGSIGSGSGAKKDPQQISSRPRNPALEEKLKNVSELYEKQFLREIVKAMRSTIHEGGLIRTGQGEKIFREELDNEYVEKWGEQGGIGIANLIYDQLMEKYGPKEIVQRPQGPIPWSNKSEIGVRRIPSPNSGISFSLDTKSEGAPVKVENPWSGILLNQISMGEDNYLLDIGHDNGLWSRLSFKGTPFRFDLRQELKAGEPLAILSPDSNQMYWNINKKY